MSSSGCRCRVFRFDLVEIRRSRDSIDGLPVWEDGCRVGSLDLVVLKADPAGGGVSYRV